MSSQRLSYEWYPTPHPYTRWMVKEVTALLGGFRGTILDPMAGNNDIINAMMACEDRLCRPKFVATDLDPSWGLPVYDATQPDVYREYRPDWSITNPSFKVALPALDRMLKQSREGVIMYHRCTLKEPLKVPGLGRSLFRDTPPNLTLWCPRFAHQRSKTKGNWSTDSATCVWSIWINEDPQRIYGDKWPPDSVFDELKAYTPQYREDVDALMGLSGTQKERKAQFIELAKGAKLPEHKHSAECLAQCSLFDINFRCTC
jgi:hypothetical protein